MICRKEDNSVSKLPFDARTFFENEKMIYTYQKSDFEI